MRQLVLRIFVGSIVILLFSDCNQSAMKVNSNSQLNIFGKQLISCCINPMTGYYRNGLCETGVSDHGTHTVCVIITQEFLDFTVSVGNDLVTPRPEFRFPGLVPGDKWCLCALRWKEAFEAGKAPLVILESTHEKTLDYVSLSDLSSHAYIEE